MVHGRLAGKALTSTKLISADWMPFNKRRFPCCELAKPFRAQSIKPPGSKLLRGLRYTHQSAHAFRIFL